MTEKVKKPKLLEKIIVEKVGYWWVGICRLDDGKKVLVSGGVLPWSVIDVTVTKAKKDFFEWRVAFIHSIPDEYATITPPCPHYIGFGSGTLTPENETTKWCWWCKRQQVSYEKQLQLKQEIVLDSFRGAQKHLETAEIRDILPSPEQRGYRNKIEYSFGDYKRGDARNTWALGFHKQWYFSQIVDIDECLLVSNTSKQIFQYIKKLCLESWLPTHNQITHKWLFRHLLIREWKNTNQFLVNLSVSDNTLDQEQQTSREAFQESLKQDEFLKKNVTSFLISLNNWLWDSIFNKDTKQFSLWGDNFIYEKLEFQPLATEENNSSEQDNQIDVTFRVSANSFFQTNTLGAQRLFSTAVSLLVNIQWPLIDLYCWTGTIGISCNKVWLGDRLFGIDIVQDAIIDAQYNAKINNITDAYFVAWKAEDLLHSDPVFAQACQEAQCIIVDPPRDWLHKNVIKFLLEQRKNKPFKLLYISCNPVTLARDITLLSEAFSVKVLQPVDMFPHTHHIENICIMN